MPSPAAPRSSAAPSRAGRAVLLAALLAAAPPLAAPARAAEPFQTTAPFAALLDAGTRSVLYERAADDLMVPASLVKLMTAEIVFRELAAGRVKLEDEFRVSENAWRRGGAPSGGSSMFAPLNSRVRVADLIPGLVVLSGNDAAIALAEGIAGSEGAFATLMTRRARELGLPRSTFANSTGLPDPGQRVTAREMARLALHLVETYPEFYKAFAQREFTWNKIRQQNRNPLLAMEIGADGLKTGNVSESGFGLVGSAVQNGQRLVVVVNGLPTARDRANEARRLLEWGFRGFESRLLFDAGAPVAEAAVFGGASASVPLVAPGAVRVLLPRGGAERLTARAVYEGPLRAPLEAGREVGRLRVMRGDAVALDVPLRVGEDVASGPLHRRAFDGAWEVAGRLVRLGFAKATGGKGGDKGGEARAE